ncbi:myb-like domain, Myb/SANT-like DNA-binding domain protein [Artemisia annua]|uniref:Myb-like domain, Myb/SANT-like DNA-binding domain protein n=1 Tax=Artemisia annua TaxID=35608 RepID=A0A2U1MG37_ARTAN|nr:myb-like domain, Myb/SANT-like DNA-binding domain protein [Artemisia annua]
MSTSCKKSMSGNKELATTFRKMKMAKLWKIDRLRGWQWVRGGAVRGGSRAETPPPTMRGCCGSVDMANQKKRITTKKKEIRLATLRWSQKNRDPRKSVRGSRGGLRGAIRPRIQSQTGHESSSQPGYPQMYSQSQPGHESSPSQPGYRPQMYPQSPPFFYNQQPLPQLPPNFEPFDYQYTQQSPPQMPTNFDPYELRYTQQKRRDRVSEPLPIHDDTEDDEYFDNVDVIPETQPIDEDAEQVDEVEEVPRPKSGKKPSKNWTPDEEEALAKAWIKISVDREVGDRQTKLGFWKRVLKHFKTLVPRTEHTHHQLNSKWTPMHQMIDAFNSYYIQAKVDATIFKFMREPNSILKNNLGKLSRIAKRGTFSKIQKKWQEQPLVSQAAESTGSSKKRKSSESSSAQTPTNEMPINVEDFDCDLPNLNENPTPSLQPKGKKKVDSGDAS